MTCIALPKLKDAHLLAYLDGGATPDIVLHVQECRCCRERAAQLAHWQHDLAATLQRGSCPSRAELGEYALNLLPARQAAAFKAHLAECLACSGELARLRDYLDDLQPDLACLVQPIPPVDASLKRIRVLIARLSAAPLGAAYAGLRGGADLRGVDIEPRLYQAGPAQVALQVQADLAHPGCQVLLGLLTGIDTTGITAHVSPSNRPDIHFDEQIDELGNLVIPALKRGKYDLILAGADVEIHIQAIEV